MNQPIAAIDLGTNTVRLLIGVGKPEGEVEQLLLKRHITRLGGGFTKERGISAEARARTIDALRDFAAEIRRHDVVRIRAVATSAVRDAANGAEFCDEIFRETGIRLEVIDGNEEALLALRGICAGIDNSDGNLLVFDVGGGSTEYTIARHEQPLFSKSLPLGVVRLTEGKVTPEAMVEKIERELGELAANLCELQMFPLPSDTMLVGTAGTATTLAAISMGMTDYDYRKVNNYILTPAEVERIYALLLPMSPEERLRVPGLEPGREDLIIAGILITLSTMNLFQFEKFKVCDFGLLEGLLRSMLTS